MKFKRYTHLLGLCFILVLVSCQDDKRAVSDYQHDVNYVLSSEQYLNTKADQPVIFQFAKYNASKDIYAGWIINNQGEIKKYLIPNTNPTPAAGSLLLINDFWSLSRNATEVIGKVDLKELVANYKLINKAFGNKTNTSEAITDGENYSAFYAYRQAEGSLNHNPTSCGGGNDYSYASYEQMFLTIDGTQQIDNEVREAKMIMDWLRATNDGLN